MPDQHLCQQDELYAAQAQGLHRGAEFGDVTRAQAYVDRVRDEPWFLAGYPQVEYVGVTIQPPGFKRSVGSFRDGEGTVALIGSQLDERTVVHELAHVLARAKHGSRSHDPWYCRTLLELVFRAFGPDEYESLRLAYLEHGVEFNPEDDGLGRGIRL